MKSGNAMGTRRIARGCKRIFCKTRPFSKSHGATFSRAHNGWSAIPLIARRHPVHRDAVSTPGTVFCSPPYPGPRNILLPFFRNTELIAGETCTTRPETSTHRKRRAIDPSDANGNILAWQTPHFRYSERQRGFQWFATQRFKQQKTV
jgi:hypothetical protein